MAGEIIPERRKYPRINFNTLVTYQTKGEPKIDYTLTRDISEGGIGLILEKFVPKNTELILTFNLKTGSNFLRAPARVAWIEKLPYAERYRAGLEFRELEPLNRLNLKRFIKREPLLLYY
ncbi:MAG: PilZ domain-containing protein [Candidatus Omnitrophica bacterium]|nr:PilZ domain-containing protein [Candidatus Omnitrophota bacterium]MCM8793975.1 PilZ domain-containing protein [Candidatus Omnitrophota bacterium]